MSMQSKCESWTAYLTVYKIIHNCALNSLKVPKALPPSFLSFLLTDIQITCLKFTCSIYNQIVKWPRDKCGHVINSSHLKFVFINDPEDKKVYFKIIMVNFACVSI